MEGGAPAGTRMWPGDDGCLITKIRMSMTTMLGNSNMKPRGIEIEEFPFSRMRRRKKENLEEPLPLCDFTSSNIGAGGV